MHFLIGADMIPTKSNEKLFSEGNSRELVGDELLDVIEHSSYRIFNLEVPLTDKEHPIKKSGPHLIAKTSTVNGYKGLGIDLLTLANNHILDQGAEGLYSTIQTLDEKKINHVGAGTNVSEACKPVAFIFAGKKVGVYACAEHEFSIADEYHPGANPFDPLWSFDHVEELKKTVDFVVVLYHGGKEHYRYPSPNLQKICRRLIDKGANLVICQHSHCIGCEEKYRGGTIVYGQGNFLFDRGDNEFRNTGILVSVDENFFVSYIPIVKNGNLVRKADHEASQKILKEFAARSEKIKTKSFLDAEYTEFAKSLSEHYLNALAGKRSFLFRVINKVTGGAYKRSYIKKTYDEKALILIESCLDCEAHRELFLRELKAKRGA